MPQFLASWLIMAVSLMITAYFIPGFRVDGILAAVIAAIAIGFANATVRPILFWLTLPISLLTLGLFYLLINAFTLWLVSVFVPGFSITGIGAALIGSVVLAVISGVLHFLFPGDHD
jgi:putative membrane protein